MKKIFTKLLLLFMVIIFSFTFISCKKRNLGTYYEIKYEVKGFKLGLIISLISSFLFIIFIRRWENERN